MDAGAGDLHITGCSAAIDMGVGVSLTDDRDGNLRPVDIPGIGISGYDIGAYELSASGVLLSHPQGARLYSGDSHTFTVGVLDAGCSLSYQWKWDDAAKAGALPEAKAGALGEGKAGALGEGKAIHDVGGDSPTLSLPDVTGLAGAYWCEVLCGGGRYVSNTAILEVADHLSIVQQPEGGSRLVGESHTFSVIVAGGYAPLGYAWKKDGGPTLSTDPVYVLDDLVVGDTGAYTVDVLDDNSDVIQSNPAELTVSVGTPVAGLVGLGVLAGGLALGCALTFRRRD